MIESMHQRSTYVPLRHVYHVLYRYVVIRLLQARDGPWGTGTVGSPVTVARISGT